MAIKIDFVCNLPVASELVSSFYAENWKRKIALSDKKFYEWQFVKTPNSENKDHCVIAYDDQKEEVLGVMGLNKREFCLNNKSFNGAELTTWIVSERGVRSGLGAKILGFIQEKFEALIGMGISDMALPIYMRSGFRYVKSIPRFVKVINLDPLKPYSTYSNLAVKLANKWGASCSNKFFAYEVSADEYDNVFRYAKERVNFFVRDNCHRIWRYDNHPYFQYKQYLVASSNEMASGKSFVAFREESTLPGFKILHIMDLFGDEKSIPSAVSFIENYAIDNGFDVIDFYCTASNVYRFMLSNGWFSINDDVCFQFPHLFHPIEMRNPPTTSLIYWAKNNFSEMADLSKLYVSKQDADLDRPTIHTIDLIEKGSV
jgi:hypothetical protein